MAEAKGVARLLDGIAEALILADLEEPGTLEDIVRASEALVRSAKRRKAPWTQQAAAFRAEAADVVGATGRERLPESLERLGRHFGELQSAVTNGGERPRTAPARKRAASRTSGDVSGEPAAAPAAPAAPAQSLAGDEELLRDFTVRAHEHLEAATEALLVLERDPAEAEALNAVFRAFHTIKGMAGFLALADIEHLAHETESVLDGPRKGVGSLDSAAFDAVFGAVDAMKALVASVLTTAPSAPIRAAAAPAPVPAAGPERRARGSVRVDEERLDKLVDTIGELVIAEAIFSGSARGTASADGAHLDRLDKITRELQAMAMSLRMVPLHATFVRMARLVRDTAHKADKDVEFVMNGDDTELDKLVVDRISDPLIHMLRNAVDHGVESPEERVAAGKPARARVELRAFHAGGRIHIEVTDDGSGLDREAILAAGRRRGLVAEHETLDERRTTELIFAPGLSTAREITDVSGRGVGMDVVRRTVESLRGEVEVSSTPGAGTRIAIRLPLTLAIIDGMVVRVGGERYVIPTLSIERSLRPVADQVSTVLGRGRLVTVGDDLVPLVELGRVFEAAGAEDDPSKAIVVVVSDAGERVGLLACELLGQQQIVIKSLGEGMQDTRGVAGGAIMPDGQVGLIVDVGGLVRLARA